MFRIYIENSDGELYLLFISPDRDEAFQKFKNYCSQYPDRYIALWEEDELIKHN